MPGLICDVFRARGKDCTNGGLTSRHDRLTLVGRTVEEYELLSR